MKTLDRFTRRRRQLAARHICTRCGSARAENGRKWCVTCLAVESDKRDARNHADEKRRARQARRYALIRAALARIEARRLT